jgi:hypothetical protein
MLGIHCESTTLTIGTKGNTLLTRKQNSFLESQAQEIIYRLTLRRVIPKQTRPVFLKRKEQILQGCLICVLKQLNAVFLVGRGRSEEQNILPGKGASIIGFKFLID